MTIVCGHEVENLCLLLCFLLDADTVSKTVKTYLIPHIFTKSLANLLFDVVVEIQNIEKKKKFLQILSKLIEFENVTFDFNKPRILKDLMTSLYEKQKNQTALSSFLKVSFVALYSLSTKISQICLFV